MPFTQDQIVAARGAFHLAGLEGGRRTLPVEADHAVLDRIAGTTRR